MTITYKNKKIKLPFDETIVLIPFEMVKRTNPFSGESIAMPKFRCSGVRCTQCL